MNRPAEVSAKVPYRAPKLLIYGNLTEMTQGSGNMGSPDGALKGKTKTK